MVKFYTGFNPGNHLKFIETPSQTSVCIWRIRGAVTPHLMHPTLWTHSGETICRKLTLAALGLDSGRLQPHLVDMCLWVSPHSIGILQIRCSPMFALRFLNVLKLQTTNAFPDEGEEAPLRGSALHVRIPKWVGNMPKRGVPNLNRQTFQLSQK